MPIPSVGPLFFEKTNCTYRSSGPPIPRPSGFLFPCRNQDVDLENVIVGKLLQILLGLLGIILGHPAVVAMFLELIHGFTSDMAHRHLAFFGQFFDELDKFLPALRA